MVSEAASPDTYIRMSGISWETFEGIADRRHGGRIWYDNGELEITSPSIVHENFGDHLRELVDALCELVGIDAICVGSTTWKAPAAKKGIESDSAWYLDQTKLATVSGLMATAEKAITRYPNPDLVIEIDLRRPDSERLSIYSAIGAVEVWEFDGEMIRLRRLGPDGGYVDLNQSSWFPITMSEIVEAITNAPIGRTTRRRWMREFVAKLVGDR